MSAEDAIPPKFYRCGCRLYGGDRPVLGSTGFTLCRRHFVVPKHPQHLSGAAGARFAYWMRSAVIRSRMVATSARVALPLGSKIVALFPEMSPRPTAHCMASEAQEET